MFINLWRTLYLFPNLNLFYGDLWISIATYTSLWMGWSGQNPWQNVTNHTWEIVLQFWGVFAGTGQNIVVQLWACVGDPSRDSFGPSLVPPPYKMGVWNWRLPMSMDVSQEAALSPATLKAISPEFYNIRQWNISLFCVWDPEKNEDMNSELPTDD